MAINLWEQGSNLSLKDGASSTEVVQIFTSFNDLKKVCKKRKKAKIFMIYYMFK